MLTIYLLYFIPGRPPPGYLETIRNNGTFWDGLRAQHILFLRNLYTLLGIEHDYDIGDNSIEYIPAEPPFYNKNKFKESYENINYRETSNDETDNDATIVSIDQFSIENYS